MSKSHAPVLPKPTKYAPLWMDTYSVKRYTKVQTDDADFGVCFTPNTRCRLRPLAWRDGRGKWREVTVDWKRVREAT
jgi:hypothetical protein